MLAGRDDFPRSTAPVALFVQQKIPVPADRLKAAAVVVQADSGCGTCRAEPVRMAIIAVSGRPAGLGLFRAPLSGLIPPLLARQVSGQIFARK